MFSINFGWSLESVLTGRKQHIHACCPPFSAWGPSRSPSPPQKPVPHLVPRAQQRGGRGGCAGFVDVMLGVFGGRFGISLCWGPAVHGGSRTRDSSQHGDAQFSFPGKRHGTIPAPEKHPWLGLGCFSPFTAQSVHVLLSQRYSGGWKEISILCLKCSTLMGG